MTATPDYGHDISGRVMLYIGHLRDHFSGFSVLFALENNKPELVAEKLAERLAILGFPLTYQSDNGAYVNHKFTLTLYPVDFEKYYPFLQKYLL